MKKKSLNILLCILTLVLGTLGGAFGFTYATIPDTDALIVGEETYYSYNTSDVITTSKLTGETGELSIHFLELGNKYTGDCTYIKYGDVDILIDCGSKASSVATVSNYLNKFITDGKIEYVIVTHAHMDHYAGFATSGKVKGIFDLYECENIIDFGTATNQQTTSKTYNNYITKRQKEIDEGANHFDASTVRQGNNKVYTIDENFKFEILYNYYYNNKAKTENDYSVCTLFTHNDKNFLFTGDLEKDGEDRLVDNNTLPEVNLFKAGHHGSKTSSNEKLLSVIKPKIVCVCCCAGSSEYTSTNVNQFPTQAFIDRVSLYTIYVYVTTLCVDYENNEYTSMNGNITVISHLNNPNISMDFSNNSTVLKDTEWFKANRTAPENWR